MTAYNAKIATTGKYLPFFGWTVISMVEDDTLDFLESEIKNNPTLNQYFSALPAESYHVTLCSIWCTGSPLLLHQQRFLSRYSLEDQQNFITQSTQRVFFNPDWCMTSLLTQIDNEAIPSTGDRLVISGIYFSGSTLGISFSTTSPVLNKARDHIRKICEINDPIIDYHLTLAYNYRDVNIDHVRESLEILNSRVCGKVLLLKKPLVAYFSDMTKFISYTKTLNNSSNRTHAPMY